MAGIPARLSGGCALLNPINKLSIRSRIYIGFFLVSSCVVLISFISIHGNRLTVAGFDEYAEINEKVKHILIVDNRVSSLQRRVQEYIYTGYEAVADQVLLELWVCSGERSGRCLPGLRSQVRAVGFHHLPGGIAHLAGKEGEMSRMRTQSPGAGKLRLPAVRAVLRCS